MNRTIQALRSRTLTLAVILLLAGTTSAFAQRGGHGGGFGGGRGGGFGGGYSNRGFSGGFNRGFRAPAFRGYSGGSNSYGRGYAPRYSVGRFYSGRGYFYGNRFWARPYYGVGVGIPFGFGYYANGDCGYYDGWGYWQPAPCYPY